MVLGSDENRSPSFIESIEFFWFVGLIELIGLVYLAESQLEAGPPSANF